MVFLSSSLAESFISLRVESQEKLEGIAYTARWREHPPSPPGISNRSATGLPAVEKPVVPLPL
jgi:hypothetical protein